MVPSFNYSGQTSAEFVITIDNQDFSIERGAFLAASVPARISSR
jgi:hypothetical protein